MTRPTEQELYDGVKRINPNAPDIVARRFAQDLTTQVPHDPDGLDWFGCVYDSGTGRCDGAYKHKGRLHLRLDGAGEIWESPW